MEMDTSSSTSNWLLDYGVVFMDDDDPFPLTAVSVSGDFSVHPAVAALHLTPGVAFSDSRDVSAAEVECSFGDADSLQQIGPCKRSRYEMSTSSGTKACKEKMRREKLNKRFLELSSILDPGRQPKTDKTAILNDAIRMVMQLQVEARKLEELNNDLQAKIKELKAEKNELREEKQKLKADKEKLEQQIKAISGQPGLIQTHSPAFPAAFAVQGQSPGNKLMPLIGYPGVAMWQFLPPAVVDTSQDHVLRPPVA